MQALSGQIFTLVTKWAGCCLEKKLLYTQWDDCRMASYCIIFSHLRIIIFTTIGRERERGREIILRINLITCLRSISKIQNIIKLEIDTH